jgi:SAM-dependent methyltransferase
MMRELLLRTYWRIAGVVVPEALPSEFTYEEVVHEHTAPDQARLDVGCGRYLIPPWRRDNPTPLFDLPRAMFGVDPDVVALAENREVPFRCAGLADNLPFADESFDLVTANMVVEHLRDPLVEFREIARVLRPGGIFVFHTPNARGYPTLLARALPEVITPNAAPTLRQVLHKGAVLVDAGDLVPGTPVLRAVGILGRYEGRHLSEVVGVSDEPADSATERCVASSHAAGW